MQDIGPRPVLLAGGHAAVADRGAAPWRIGRTGAPAAAAAAAAPPAASSGSESSGSGAASGSSGGSDDAASGGSSSSGGSSGSGGGSGSGVSGDGGEVTSSSSSSSSGSEASGGGGGQLGAPERGGEAGAPGGAAAAAPAAGAGPAGGPRRGKTSFGWERISAGRFKMCVQVKSCPSLMAGSQALPLKSAVAQALFKRLPAKVSVATTLDGAPGRAVAGAAVKRAAGGLGARMYLRDLLAGRGEMWLTGLQRHAARKFTLHLSSGPRAAPRRRGAGAGGGAGGGVQAPAPQLEEQQEQEQQQGQGQEQQQEARPAAQPPQGKRRRQQQQQQGQGQGQQQQQQQQEHQRQAEPPAPKKQRGGGAASSKGAGGGPAASAPPVTSQGLPELPSEAEPGLAYEGLLTALGALQRRGAAPGRGRGGGAPLSPGQVDSLHSAVSRRLADPAQARLFVSADYRYLRWACGQPGGEQLVGSFLRRIAGEGAAPAARRGGGGGGGAGGGAG
ncbi:MAG: hypothetical protein J3K34DRAFT_522723 [Monoraphidium minutum]|nr:MAG: hypothetical protein J3K34DRAFT_522723 [Monoraphidium minutum]